MRETHHGRQTSALRGCGGLGPSQNTAQIKTHAVRYTYVLLNAPSAGGSRALRAPGRHLQKSHVNRVMLSLYSGLWGSVWSVVGSKYDEEAWVRAATATDAVPSGLSSDGLEVSHAERQRLTSRAAVFSGEGSGHPRGSGLQGLSLGYRRTPQPHHIPGGAFRDAQPSSSPQALPPSHPGSRYKMLFHAPLSLQAATPPCGRLRARAHGGFSAWEPLAPRAASWGKEQKNKKPCSFPQRQSRPCRPLGSSLGQRTF